MAWRYSRYARRAVQGLVCLAVTLVLLQHQFQLIDTASLLARRHDTWPWASSCPGTSSAFEQPCPASNPRAAVAIDTLIVVRTGGSEPQSRLQAQIDSILSKIPEENILIFSDLDEVVGPFRVRDVFADVSAQERALYPEFALYDAQQEYLALGKDTRELSGGWDLSKYTNLAMTRTLWKLLQQHHPPTLDKKWFLFIDTDTFIEWDNLLELLAHLSPTQSHYLGSPVWLPGLQFAHGGSAYVLSYAALDALNTVESRHGAIPPQDPRSKMHSQYGLDVTSMCCGDEALARVLQSKGVRLRGYWPLFNGEAPAGLAFAQDLWCEPLVSLHHLDAQAMQSVWRWAEEWRKRTGGVQPLLFKDLFEYVYLHLPLSREDWDNMHDSMRVFLPPDVPVPTSFEECREACVSDVQCFQYVFNETTCVLSHHIRLGMRRGPEEDAEGAPRRFVSGWNLERIRNWANEEQCEGAKWLRSNP